MIETIHYIAARQTGKTSKAIELFREYNGPYTYLMVYNNHLKRNISGRYGIPSEKILIANKYLPIQRIDILIVDEFLLGVEDKNYFLTCVLILMYCNNAKLFLFSTPDKIYTNDFVNNQHEYFLTNFNDDRILNIVIDTTRDPEYYGFRCLSNGMIENLRNILSPTEFEVKIIGKYLENQPTKFYLYRPKRFSLKNMSS